MASIPHEFHFVFGLQRQREPFHLMHYLCLESCRRVNRPSSMHFYYLYEPFGPYWDAIRPFLNLERVPKNSVVAGFKYHDSRIKPYRYAHHSDFIRLVKLLEHGGIYADMDTLFVRPLPAELFDKQFVLGEEGESPYPGSGPYQRSLCNALILAAPRAEFGRRWLKIMYDEFDGSWSNHSTLLPRRLADRFPQLVHIEPQRSFFYFPASIFGLAALFEGFLPIPDDVYSIHLWQHLWWDESRLDFSHFYSGRLTRDFIEQAETTYSAAARPFLPPASVAALETRWPTRVIQCAKRIRTTVNQQVRTLVGLAAYPLLLHHLPGAADKLRLARGHRAYKIARRHFTVRNAFESSVLRQVIQWDEYRIFRERFGAEDVVIDIGAHIGAFCFACHALGSRRIHAFEAHPGNFELLKSNLSRLEGVHLHLGAVFRSDERPGNDLLPSASIFSNTGGEGEVFGRNLFKDLWRNLLKPQQEGVCTAIIALDQVVGQFDCVQLLKLDCEGGEYPILFTSRQLKKVRRIVGEYHTIPTESMPLLIPEARLPGHEYYGPETLRWKLEEEGFHTTFSGGEVQGLFDAVRRNC